MDGPQKQWGAMNGPQGQWGAMNGPQKHSLVPMPDVPSFAKTDIEINQSLIEMRKGLLSELSRLDAVLLAVQARITAAPKIPGATLCPRPSAVPKQPATEECPPLPPTFSSKKRSESKDSTASLQAMSSISSAPAKPVTARLTSDEHADILIPELVLTSPTFLESGEFCREQTPSTCATSGQLSRQVSGQKARSPSQSPRGAMEHSEMDFKHSGVEMLQDGNCGFQGLPPKRLSATRCSPVTSDFGPDFGPASTFSSPRKGGRVGSKQAFDKTLSSAGRTARRLFRAALSPTQMLEEEDRQAQKVALEVVDEKRRITETKEFEAVPINCRQKFVKSNTFEVFFVVMILVNGFISGIEVEYQARHLGEPEPRFFMTLRHMFTAIFAIELILRVVADGPCRFFRSRESAGWAWLDLFIVSTSLMDSLVDILLQNGLIEDDSATGTDSFRIIRMLRVTRLMRAFRLHRVVRFIASLRTLVYTISVTLRSLWWAMVLLCMVMYAFTISIMQETNDYLAKPDANPQVAMDVQEFWGSMDKAMVTLYQGICGGISWRVASKPLEDVSGLSVLLFMLFIGFVYFAVLNVVTGVFCNCAIQTAQRNPDMVAASLVEHQKAYTNHLRALFKSLDKDESGFITLHEFEALNNDDMLLAYFAALEIDFNDAWTMFKLIDSQRTGAIQVDDFISACLKLKGGATNVELARMGTDLRNVGKLLCNFMKTTEDRLEEMYVQLQRPTHWSRHPARLEGDKPAH